MIPSPQTYPVPSLRTTLDHLGPWPWVNLSGAASKWSCVVRSLLRWPGPLAIVLPEGQQMWLREGHLFHCSIPPQAWTSAGYGKAQLHFLGMNTQE